MFIDRKINMPDLILEAKRLTKEFKEFTAVSDVSLKVLRGHIHALIGPNGAGKTTCFNLLTKFLVPTAGQILFNGRDITSLKSAQIVRQDSLSRLNDRAMALLAQVDLGAFADLITADLPYGRKRASAASH